MVLEFRVQGLGYFCFGFWVLRLRFRISAFMVYGLGF